MKKEFTFDVSWTVWAKQTVEAESREEAYKMLVDPHSTIPLPTESHYLDESYQVEKEEL